MMDWIRPRGVSVFVFHSVESNAPADRSWVTSEERFQNQLDFIAEHFQVLTVSEMLTVQRMRTSRKPIACITFDDGDSSWGGLVREALGKRGLKATFYVATNQVLGQPIWHDRLSHCLAAIQTPQLHLPWLGIRNMPFASHDERALVSDRLGRLFKYQHPANREKMLIALEALTGTSAPREGLSVADLRRLLDGGHEIGSHTQSHPILSRCEDADAWREIAESREILGSAVGVEVNSFSFPNGKPGFDYLPRHVDMVRRAGYRSAVSTALGSYRPGSSVWQIPRFTPWGRSAGSMRRQIFINSWSSVAQVKETENHQEPARVLVVENGTGFGGAVVALRTLLSEGLPMPVTYGVVSGGDYGFGSMPNVSMTALASSHSRRFDAFAARASRQFKWIPGSLKAFILGRIDDLCVRLPYLLRLVSIGLRFKPDLVHGNNELISNREALLLAKILRVPYVQHVRAPSPTNAKLGHLIGLPDLSVTVSRWLYFASLERGVHPSRVLQVYDGVAIPKPKTGEMAATAGSGENTLIERRRPVVAMVGMLVPWKGQSIFIEAVAQIRSAHPDATFLIVGGTPDLAGGEYESELRAKVATSALADAVQFAGQIPDLSTRMYEFDILVSASLEPEPLGLVMIEALRSGCYFVGPDHGATAEFISDETFGRLFKQGNATELAKALSVALSERCRFTPEARKLRTRDLSDVNPSISTGGVSAAYQSVLSCTRR